MQINCNSVAQTQALFNLKFSSTPLKYGSGEVSHLKTYGSNESRIVVAQKTQTTADLYVGRHTKTGLMSSKLGISLLCFLASLGSAGESKLASRNLPQRNTVQTASAASTNTSALETDAKSKKAPASSAGSLDACALIEKSEIESVQGTPVQQTQPTGYAYGDVDISQCYYTAISADGKNLSVHVQLIQRDPKSSRRDAVKEFWEARFGRESREKRENKEKEDKLRGEREEDEAINSPVPVAGVGDEAVWLGSNRGGALFVRKKDKLVRVSVGGADDTKVKIEKSKTLAKKALARLR